MTLTLILQTEIGAMTISNIWQVLDGFGKRTAHVITVVPLVVFIVALKAVQPLVVFHAVVVSELIHDLSHQQEERGKGRCQAHDVKKGRQFEAPCCIDDAVENLAHGQRWFCLCLTDHVKQ